MRAVNCRITIAFCTVAGAALVLAASSAGARAATAPQPQTSVVSAVPSARTPNFGDGAIQSILQVGNRIVAGGTFSTVTSPGSTTTLSRPYLAAFDATTGVVDPSFLPVVDGEVDALLPSLDGSSVYVAGLFTNVNGVTSRRLALVSLASGATVTSFRVPSIDGIVTDLAMVNNRLYLAGTFGHLGSITHAGLASLNPATGAVDPFMSLQLSGHHNYKGPKTNTAYGAVGAKKFAASPDGNTLVVIGNFTQVSGTNRDQIVMLDISGSAAAVNPNWKTTAYTSPCFAWAYDSYVRGIQFSPDGSYFVVVSSGGYFGGSFQVCDAAARWEANSTGSRVSPTWVDYTGTDSLYSVAVTGTAVYVGGHERWLNNPYGQDAPGPGAVPRPGLAALDPTNGVPLSWNPGRNPRGHGAEALLATPGGLWVGSDTSFIGNYRYRRGRIAFFPLAGGQPVAVVHAGTLPGNVFLAGRLATPSPAPGTTSDDLSGRPFDGTTTGPTTILTGSGITWSQARGAFMINGTLYYGWSDGNLYTRTFDGTAFGAPVLVDPYEDPTWAGVATGSGGTYKGAKSNFDSEIPNVTGMFFSVGRIYYTLSGDAVLHSRSFTPDSGIVGDPELTADNTFDWSDAGGMFMAGGQLYWATRTDGSLHRVAFDGGRPTGPATFVSGPAIDGNDWRTRALFLQTS